MWETEFFYNIFHFKVREDSYKKGQGLDYVKERVAKDFYKLKNLVAKYYPKNKILFYLYFSYKFINH